MKRGMKAHIHSSHSSTIQQCITGSDLNGFNKCIQIANHIHIEINFHLYIGMIILFWCNDKKPICEVATIVVMFSMTILMMMAKLIMIDNDK